MENPSPLQLQSIYDTVTLVARGVKIVLSHLLDVLGVTKSIPIEKKINSCEKRVGKSALNIKKIRQRKKTR